MQRIAMLLGVQDHQEMPDNKKIQDHQEIGACGSCNSCNCCDSDSGLKYSKTFSMVKCSVRSKRDKKVVQSLDWKSSIGSTMKKSFVKLHSRQASILGQSDCAESFGVR